MHHHGTYKRPLSRPCSPWASHRIVSVLGLEYLDGIVYRALQALGCAAASTAERETANYQETQQVTRCHTQLARSQGLTRGRVRYGGFLYATAASRRPRAESKPSASLFLQGTPGCALWGPCKSIQSSYPQVCPFAPKWMGLIQANAWWKVCARVRDWFMCEEISSLIIHKSSRTQSLVCRWVTYMNLCVWRDSFICVLWLHHDCHRDIHTYVWHVSFAHVTWLIPLWIVCRVWTSQTSCDTPPEAAVSFRVAVTLGDKVEFLSSSSLQFVI